MSHAINNISKVNRRQFLGGVSAVMVIAPLPAMALAGASASFAPVQYAARAVHQQQSFIDLSGHASRYTAPAGNHSTRAYRAALTQEEFLRRHWFS
jgi:hypothetical protein